MLVIPGAVIITWFLNIVLPSAVGIAAAVGVLLIPALIALGVPPVMAGAAVFLGTWGSVASPGLMFNPQVADLAFKAGEISSPDAMIVIMSVLRSFRRRACWKAVRSVYRTRSVS